MAAYLLRRLLLLVPTLFGIIAINFAVVQFAPGGPVEQAMAEARGQGGNPTERISSTGGETSTYRGARGLSERERQQLVQMFGFDKPPLQRFAQMVWGYLRFDLGRSFFKDATVAELIAQRMPVSVSLGLWSTLLIYLVSIPLGIAKAVRDGSRFDVATSGVVLVGYAIPGFLFAVLLVVLFAGGSFLQLFPSRGLVSPDSQGWPFWQRAADYAWHLVLPTAALVVGGFASLTILSKNCFLDEIRKQYVTTARAKGAGERRVLYGHVFRNAMLLVVAGFPATFLGLLFSSSLLVEVVFSLDGLGRLGFESVVRRDYPVVLGTLYVFTLLGLVLQVGGDLLYTVVDPRIDFEARA